MNTSRSFVPSEYHEYALASLIQTHAYTEQPFSEWQQGLGGAFKQCLGWSDNRYRGSLEVEEIEREQTPDYLRRKLVFTSEPGADVVCHLLIPNSLTAPAAAFICLQGHGTGAHLSVGQSLDPGEDTMHETDYDFAVQAAREGYIALAVEQRCFGERMETRQKQRSQSTCEDAAMHALLLGRTLASERVWDVSRAIDLLETLPEARRDRICCMGHSGGGLVTFYAACVDPRIWLAMPACSFCTFVDSIFRIHHCTDNFLPGILTVAETGDLAGLIAPRRLVIVNGRHDDIFPIAGAERAYAAAQRVYEASGAPNNVRLLIGEGGHRFYASLGWPAVKEMMDAA